MRRAAWLLAGGGLALGFYVLWLEGFGLRADSGAGDESAEATLGDRIGAVLHDSAAARVRLARDAESASDLVEAERHLRRALELEPGVASLTQLGHFYARAEMWEQAAASYDEALALAPDDADLLKWTVRVNLNLDRPARMRELIERQLAQRPDDAILHLRLASVAKRLGDLRSAIRHEREVIRIGASDPALRNDVAWTLATSRDEQVRDPDEAIRLAEALVGEDPLGDPNEIDTLAAAYAAAGRFDEAVATALRAASLADERGQTELAESIRSRVEIYRSQRPYVEAEASNGA